MTQAPATQARGIPDLPPPSRWIAPASGSFCTPSSSVAPLLTPSDFAAIAPGLDVWDAWPVQQADGHPADIGGGRTLWMALGAPHFADPDLRHSHARIHLLLAQDGGWTHLGPAMPEGFSPGSREWSGSAVIDPSDDTLTLYFTATGQRGEGEPSFLQRLFRARATLQRGERPQLADWRDLAEVLVRDPAHYMASDQGTGTIGTIKAFRDPAYFLDPQSGRSYLLFTASAAQSSSDYNGVIGMATACDEQLDKWQVGPPLVSADGLNNELERPHAIYRDGRYYLFWSTQSHVFDPSGPVGPTGLYGMVASDLMGEWRPLNGTGLVFANPPGAPAQAYSWLVMPDLRVTSFVDDWGPDDGKVTRNFGGTFAPMLSLEIDGDEVRLAV